ncbi:unnamed protein product [Ambrosiozyma monospora]|uniref:Unnamed protein product n=1 Tax=Ambrosiozyma monospora TaxID=43982 RepID=A0ACB5TTG1_AMBMO|nr:unnamed protein product [Ambrosiozyma monospora]
MEIKALAGVSLPDHLKSNEVAKLYMDNKYRIIVSNMSMNLVLSFLMENEGIGGAVAVRIMNNFMEVITQTEVTTESQMENNQSLENQEGIPAIYQLLTESQDKDSKKDKSKEKNGIETLNSKEVKLGKFPNDPEFAKELEAELKHKDENQKDHHFKKSLMDEYNENFKSDSNSDNAPSRDTLPLPQKTAYDIKREITKIQDSRAQIRLNTPQAALPSVCMYTFHNTNNDMTCLSFNDDSTIVAGGFQDSFIKLWSIDGSPLKSVLKNDEHNRTIDGVAS